MMMTKYEYTMKPFTAIRAADIITNVSHENSSIKICFRSVCLHFAPFMGMILVFQFV